MKFTRRILLVIFMLKAMNSVKKKGKLRSNCPKNFVRQWLISQGFQGKEGQEVPFMSDEYIESISERYIELYENIMGEPFVKADVTDINQRIEKNVLAYLQSKFVKFL